MCRNVTLALWGVGYVEKKEKNSYTVEQILSLRVKKYLSSGLSEKTLESSVPREFAYKRTVYLCCGFTLCRNKTYDSRIRLQLEAHDVFFSIFVCNCRLHTFCWLVLAYNFSNIISFSFSCFHSLFHSSSHIFQRNIFVIVLACVLQKKSYNKALFGIPKMEHHIDLQLDVMFCSNFESSPLNLYL